MTEKPMIREIILVTGEIINDAILETDAERIPGFLAIQSQQYKETTEYIALSAVSSMAIKNEELVRFSGEYLSPVATVKVKSY